MNALIYALGVLVFVVGIAVSIGLHELGHMYPAKKFGVKVTQYFIGFGSTIWSTRRGETEYGIKAIPLGGYVKLVGMLPPPKDADPHEVRDTNTGLFTQLATDARNAEYETVTDADMPRLFYRLPWWKKVIVMAGGPMMNVVIAVVLFGIVIMGFGALRPTTTVEAVSDCAISDAEQGRSCTAADPVTPARQAGLQAGDLITSFAGRPVDSWDELSRAIRENGSATAELDYVRDGREEKVTINPTVIARADLDDPDETVEVGFLGVRPTFENQRGTPLDVATTIGTYGKSTALAIWNLPPRMVDVTKAAFGAERDPDGPIGVVGASRISGELVTYDDPTWAERASRVLSLIAGLNLFLALFNLIPLLPFDGGHIAGALWEALRRGLARFRGRPDPGFVDVAKALPVAYGVGMVLILMSVILVYADIVNPVKLS
jgi:membrane-associated protease RseP (regulator of RpoE activity)